MSSDINVNNPQIPYIKRFLELYCGDRGFRELLYEDTSKANNSNYVSVDAKEIRPLWDLNYVPSDNEVFNKNVRDYQDFHEMKGNWREKVRKECEPSNERFKIWRQRQISRCKFELGDMLNDRLIHTPLMFELGDGCSVGCKFCGLNAKPLKTLYLYTEENKKEWREILETCKNVIGEASKWGVCYYATEPLDNPDYEKFCLDYAKVFGVFPQTTTAIALKNVERTRNLLKLSQENGGVIDRFSVLSLPALYKIFECFTPEELAYVELIEQNEESIAIKSASGRFLTAIEDNPELLKNEINRVYGKAAEEHNIVELPATISCASGFVINMVTRSCRLITPCKASKKNPCGYKICGEKTFKDAKDFEKVLLELINENMQVAANELPVIKLREGMTLECVTNLDEKTGLECYSFEIGSEFRKLKIKEENNREFLIKLMDYIDSSKYNESTLAMLIFYGLKIEENSTRNLVDLLFKFGLLEE